MDVIEKNKVKYTSYFVRLLNEDIRIEHSHT